MDNEPIDPFDPTDPIESEQSSASGEPDEVIEPPPAMPVPAVVPPPPPSGSGPVATMAGAAASDATRRNWGAGAHASAIVASFVAGLAVLGPLVVWLVKKEEDPWVAEHAREALNFQLTWMIGGFVGAIAALVFGVLTVGLGLVLIVPAALGLFIAWLVFTIKGALAASRGETYRYPMSIRMVS